MGHVFDITTGLPIAGALIQSGAAVTDSNGFYLYTNILIGSGSVTNVTIGLSSFASGYFQSFSNVVLDAGLTNTQDFRLLKEGFGFVIGTVRDSATTLPLTNIFVSFSGIGSVTTDSNGAYVSPPIPLPPEMRRRR